MSESNDSKECEKVADEIITECTIGNYDRVDVLSFFFETSMLRFEDFPHMGNMRELMKKWAGNRKRTDERLQR